MTAPPDTATLRAPFTPPVCAACVVLQFALVGNRDSIEAPPLKTLSIEMSPETRAKISYRNAQTLFGLKDA